MKRREGQSFENYKKERSNANFRDKEYLEGRVICCLGRSTRKARRKSLKLRKRNG